MRKFLIVIGVILVSMGVLVFGSVARAAKAEAELQVKVAKIAELEKENSALRASSMMPETLEGSALLELSPDRSIDLKAVLFHTVEGPVAMACGNVYRAGSESTLFFDSMPIGEIIYNGPTESRERYIASQKLDD